MATLTVYTLTRHHHGRYAALRDWDQLHERYDDTVTRPFAGEPMAEFWQPVDLVDDEESNTMVRPTGLLYSYNSFLVLSQASYQKYKTLLEPFGEFLPATYQSEAVELFHCTNLLPDAIDKENTVHELGHICGPLIDWRKVCFNTDVVDRPMLFRTGTLGRRIWISTLDDRVELLRMFLDNQTGVLPQPVFVARI